MKLKFISLFFALVMFVSYAFSAVTNASALALQGYDVVSYFSKQYPKEDLPLKGSVSYTSVYEGKRYLFVSSAHKNAFEVEPKKYLPQYDGWCAYGVAVERKIVANPRVWKIVDGKLYINLSKRVANTWEEDIPGYIKKANESWPQIYNKEPSGLLADFKDAFF